MAITVRDTGTLLIVCSDTANTTVNVTYNPCASQITAIDQGSGTFAFSSYMPAGGSGMSYLWDFGDGNTSTQPNPLHTYASQGGYTVTLTTSGGGCIYVNTITVFNGSVLNVSDCSMLNAGFTYATAGNTVTFNNTSSLINAGGYGYNYVWNFGDGTTQFTTLPNSVTHTYSAPGVYQARLDVQWFDSSNWSALCDDTFYLNVVVNSIPVVNAIEGSIISDTLYTPSDFMVYLILHDSAANTLYAVDSTYAIGTGTITPYQFINPAAGSYLIKAAPLNQLAGMNGLVPTYHDSSLYWSAAQYVGYGGSGVLTGNHVWMQQGIVSSGPGFIGGNISQGANKGTSTGVPDILVFLRDASNKLVSATYTDANGDYSFTNIPAGTYNVYPEDLNRATTYSGNFVLYSNQPTVTNINFYHDSTTIVPVTLNVSEVLAANETYLYPNPVSDVLNIQPAPGITGHLVIDMIDITGKRVATLFNEERTTTILSLSIPQSATNGVYFITISGADTRLVRKVLVNR